MQLRVTGGVTYCYLYWNITWSMII